MKFWPYVKETVKRGMVSLVRRRIYLIMMVAVPLLTAFFFLDLMWGGSVQQAPVGIVDMDHSSMSRSLSRHLRAMQQVKVTREYGSFTAAREAVQRGEVLGFFFIPSDLSEKALSGQHPTLSYYIDYSFYAPASMQYKGFKTMTVLANGAIAMNVMQTMGANERQMTATLQPVALHMHAINNPWLNYSYYLNISFIPALLALIIFLITSFSIGIELKYGTSIDWVRRAGGSMGLALTGKLLPQTVIFTVVGWVIQWMMYVWAGLPLNCNPWHMILAMPLFVLANQAFALTVMCIVPNFRYGSTICSLIGVLAFSLGAFSLPKEAMYDWVGALSYILPVRYYFLLSIDQALNGIDFYYSRWYYAALVAFTALPWLLITRLKRECLHPVYVP